MATGRWISLVGVSACFVFGCFPAAAAPIDGTFNYQGRLTEAGAPVTGNADLSFRLYDDAAAGGQIGSEIELLAVPVSGGLFNVDLDFGVASFNGDQRWIEIDARSPAGVGGYTTLTPRQPILGTPYAIQTRGIFVDANNNVGIGTTSPNTALSVEATGTAIFGHANSVVTFISGVHGVASGSTSTVNYGVRGGSDSTSGRGVYGEATANGGNTYGVYGEARSPSGRGVFGEATASSGTTDGVFGHSISTSGRGVCGLSSASSGTTYGVFGTSDSGSGAGVSGEARAATGTTYGGLFVSMSTSGRGVWGKASASSGITFGGRFMSSSTSGRGVSGEALTSSGINYGVYGKSNSSSGFDFYADGAGTNYGSSSSRRWKENVVPIGDPLEKLGELRGVYFDWDTDHGGHHDVGMIAEEVGEVLPEIVQYEANGVDAIGMDYSKTTPLLVEAVKALQSKHDAEIEALRAENEAMRERLEYLERTIESRKPSS